MYLRDVAIYADESLVEQYQGGFVQRFHRQTCCITEFFLSTIYREVVTDGVGGVGITFHSDSKPATADHDLRELLTAVCFSWPFDFAMYQTWTDDKRKAEIAAAMRSALIWLAKSRGWNIAPLENGYMQMAAKHFCLEGTSKKVWGSPCRRFRAKIAFQFGLDGVELAAVLYRMTRKEEVARLPLGTALPQTDCLRNYLRKGRWLHRTRFELRSTDFLRKVWIAEFKEWMGTSNPGAAPSRTRSRLKGTKK